MANKVAYVADFTAETGVAEENVKRYTAQLRAANAALAQAERTAKQSYQEQRSQAIATGASTEQLNRITQDYNRSLYAIGQTAKNLGATLAEANRGAISGENTKAEAVELTNKELQAQVQIVNELAAANTRNNHEAVSGVQATSAAIRGLEGSGGIRAIENFISKTLGLGPAMQAIFPVIGAGMFLKMLWDVGEGIYNVGEKAAHASETIKTGFDEQHAKAQINISDLTIQADKLQDSIDKISGHPGNGLQTALDEARRYADKLQQSLRADTKELQALFKENSVGTFGSMLSGVASTAKQEQNLLADRAGLTKQFEGINADYNRAAANAKSTDEIKRLGEQRDKAISDATSATIQRYRGEAKRLREEQAQANSQSLSYDASGQSVPGLVKDNSAKITEVEGDANKLQTLLDTQAAQKRVTALSEQEGNARQAKEDEEARKRLAKSGASAASAAATAARQIEEAQRRDWEEQTRIAKDGGQLTSSAEAQAWDARANSVRIGSANWVFASNKGLEAVQRDNVEHRKLLDESIKMQEQFRAAQQKGTVNSLLPGMASDAKGFQDQQNSLRALLDAQRESTYQQALAQAQLDASAGKISQYDAAVQLQTLHTNEYAAQLSQLQEALAAVDGQDNESIAKRNAITKQITDLTTKQQTDAMRDTANVAAQTWQGALTNANASWVQNSRDSAKQVGELYQSALFGVNGNIVNAMMGEKTSWGSTFKGIGKQVAGMGLQRAESGLLSKFGFGGKADGSKGNPLHVVMDGSGATSTGAALGGVGTSLAKSLFSFLPGGSMLSGLFGGGRAIGGGVDSGTTYLVGERGPELLTMGGKGYVTPNHGMRDALGGSTAHYVIYTNDGVTSEQVHQQVQSALREAHPRVVRDSVHAIREGSARGPASSR